MSVVSVHDRQKLKGARRPGPAKESPQGKSPQAKTEGKSSSQARAEGQSPPVKPRSHEVANCATSCVRDCARALPATIKQVPGPTPPGTRRPPHPAIHRRVSRSASKRLAVWVWTPPGGRQGERSVYPLQGLGRTFAPCLPVRSKKRRTWRLAHGAHERCSPGCRLAAR